MLEPSDMAPGHALLTPGKGGLPTSRRRFRLHVLCLTNLPIEITFKDSGKTCRICLDCSRSSATCHAILDVYRDHDRQILLLENLGEVSLHEDKGEVEGFELGAREETCVARDKGRKASGVLIINNSPRPYEDTKEWHTM